MSSAYLSPLQCLHSFPFIQMDIGPGEQVSVLVHVIVFLPLITDAQSAKETQEGWEKDEDGTVGDIEYWLDWESVFGSDRKYWQCPSSGRVGRYPPSFTRANFISRKYPHVSQAT